MNRFEEKYRKEIVPKLKQELGLKNDMEVPRVEKITINIGLGKSIQDPSYLDVAIETVRRITGIQPVKTLAKKSISNFKIRGGMVVGAKATLRGERMYAFLDKMINVTLPRVRDFQGLSDKSFDGNGNYSIGFSEHIVFPEISLDEVEKTIGLEINIATTAKNDEQGRKLLELMEFPFQKNKQQK